MVMAVAYPVSLVAYSKMPSAIPEGEAFIRGIVAQHPDAVFYSAHPRYHDPPLETVVYADRLAQADIIRALQAGRSFVTRRPDGVECYLGVLITLN